MFELKGKYTGAKVMIDEIEPECLSQINSFLNHPAFTNSVAIMPDAHAGAGSCVGFTMELTDKVIPNIVGVDIGCGMVSFNIGKNLPISLEELDYKIRQRIPFGQNIHDHSVINLEKEFPWHSANIKAEKFALAYYQVFGTSLPKLPKYNMEWFLNKCKSIGGDTRRFINSLGTLGGGNHFIELGISQSSDHWLTIHSGSRNFGKRICEFWQKRAVHILIHGKKDKMREEIEKIKEQYKYTPHKIKEEIQKLKAQYNFNIDMKGKEWLEDDDAGNYLYDMIIAQTYAEMNRSYMARIIKDILRIKEEIDEIETVHNFIDFQDFIIRKGAIRSYPNERMLIPFNMRDGILICTGKGNKEWNCSAPHGAGRLMSRSSAKKKLNLDQFKNEMEGIYSTSVCQGTLDEAPGAYKDSKLIETTIGPTADIADRIRPIMNMKDSGEFKRKGKNYEI